MAVSTSLQLGCVWLLALIAFTAVSHTGLATAGERERKRERGGEKGGGGGGGRERERERVCVVSACVC